MTERLELGGGAFVTLTVPWLPESEADALLEALRDELDWESRSIRLFGRTIQQPRLIAWAGDAPYRYSGQTLPARSAPAVLRDLMQRVSDEVGVPFNHALCNRYRDGRDSMGMHSDDEPELGDSPVLAGVSLGARRRFVLASKKHKSERHSLWLEHNSLLVMGGSCQHRYRHGVPKDAEVKAERINVTFRLIEKGESAF